jgi:hypothetical protein
VVRWLPLPSMVFVFALTACTSSETGSDRADPPDSSPAASEVVAPEAQPTPVTTTDGPESFFAVLGQTGVEHCPEGSYDPTWLAIEPTLGFVSVSGLADEELEPLMDQPVLARGAAGPAPKRAPLAVEPRPCPMMQMRSDWVNTPRGIRVRRAAPLDIPHFHATSLRRLDELTLEREGEQVRVRFTNPLPFALKKVAVEIHYEGCYGKPGTTSLTSDRVALEPGEALEHRFPLIAEKAHRGERKGGPSARLHRAADLVLSLPAQAGPEGQAVHTDLTVSLRDLGVEFECPGE